MMSLSKTTQTISTTVLIGWVCCIALFLFSAFHVHPAAAQQTQSSDIFAAPQLAEGESFEAAIENTPVYQPIEVARMSEWQATSPVTGRYAQDACSLPSPAPMLSTGDWFPQANACQMSVVPNQVQSYFMPSFGRFGCVAPVPPSGPADCIPCGENAHDEPCTGVGTWQTPYDSQDFGNQAGAGCSAYDGAAQEKVYSGKHMNPVQRPWVEWGVPLFLNGPIPKSINAFGITNLAQPKLYVYGDYRVGVGYSKQNGNDVTVAAHRLNLDIDLWLTATERIHMFLSPLAKDGNFSRFVIDGGDTQYREAFDFFDENTDTLFFEGDLGAIFGGMIGDYAPFDIPFTAGLIPLLFQNGIWMEDAFLGVAATIPARNSPKFDWSNFDVTFFAGFDEINSPAFAGDDSAANMYGAITFIEAKGGYFEAGYAYLEDQRGLGRSYHNLGISYTRRYLSKISNSVRLLINTGQDGPVGSRTADGQLLLIENSFITSRPYNMIPYVNFFAGFGNPQSVARTAGPLKNTGINFESDLLTGFTFLDDSANNTWGAAFGLDLLAPDFSQQLILEAAVLQTFNGSQPHKAPGDQYALGLRYQLPISNSYILRFDAMHGWLENTEDITGIRMELRHKF